PLDKPRPPVKTFNGASLRAPLDPQLTQGLLQVAHHHQASLFMVLLAAYKALLHYYTGARDMAVGTPVSGRTHFELENQIGFYVNMLALRTRFAEEDTFAGLLAKVKETVLNAYQHQAYPFDQLVADLEVGRNVNRGPIFDTGITWHSGLQPAKSETDFALRVQEHEVDSKMINADLWLHAGETGDQLWFSLNYNTDLFDEPKVELLKDRLVNLLQKCAETPHLSLTELYGLIEKDVTPQLEGLDFVLDMNF
ncbi:MAG: hypothetical protein ICV83_28165, partial [Cytophagales bacterium]|nr:hypothetical protein [Cytophagales bacterium]